MKKIISMVMVLALLVVGFSLSSEAFGGPQSKGNVGGAYGNKGNYNNVSQQYEGNYNNPLDLDDEQLEQIEEIREDFFENRENLQEKLQENNYELRQALLNNENEEVIANLRTKINNLQSDINNQRVNYWGKIQNVLTDNQLEELKSLENEYGAMGFGMYNNMNNYNDQFDNYGPKGSYGRGNKRTVGNRGFRGNCGW